MAKLLLRYSYKGRGSGKRCDKFQKQSLSLDFVDRTFVKVWDELTLCGLPREALVLRGQRFRRICRRGEADQVVEEITARGSTYKRFVTQSNCHKEAAAHLNSLLDYITHLLYYLEGNRL